VVVAGGRRGDAQVQLGEADADEAGAEAKTSRNAPRAGSGRVSRNATQWGGSWVACRVLHIPGRLRTRIRLIVVPGAMSNVPAAAGCTGRNTVRGDDFQVGQLVGAA